MVNSWDGVGGNGGVGRRSSLWWRDMKSLGGGTNLSMDWFNELAKKKLGDGSTINFWTDIWLGRESFEGLFPNLFNSVEQKDAKVAEMGSWEESGWTWRMPRFVGLSAEAANSAAELSTLLIGVSPARDSGDKWHWLLDNVRGFNVKQCYGWLVLFFVGVNGDIEGQLVNACKKLWRNDVPSKILIFNWRLLQNKLATRDALARRGMLHSTQDRCCVLCSNEEETVSHLFFSCEVAREVWRLAIRWLGVSLSLGNGAMENFVEFGKLLKGKKRRRVKHLIWMAVTWCLWRTRNNVLFRGETASVTNILHGVKLISWGWFMARGGRNCGISWADWVNCPMGCFLSM